MISSLKRERCIITAARAESSSTQKSRSETASMLLRQGPSKPRAAAVIRRSVG